MNATKLKKELNKLGIKSFDELEEYIANHLKYLEMEGFVTKVGDRYRIKTKKEVKQEIESIN
jgi:hypothetical protein